MSTQPTASSMLGALRAPIVDQGGNASYTFLKSLQDFNTRITNIANAQGQLLGSAQLSVRNIALSTLLKNIDANGIILGPGIDFTRPYLNKTTDNITDGTGHPLAGGKTAYTALVTSGPMTGQVLEWNGTAWLPATLAANVSSLDGITGAVNLVAGSGITISDNTPSPGKITIAGTAVSGSYVKGSISIGPAGGAGTLTASGTITGAAVGSAVTVGVVNSTEAGLVSNLLGWVTSTNNVTIQATFSASSLALNLPVVVFN